jgi:hypothetical protein
LRRIGVLAATLVLILVPSGCTGDGEAGAHSCTARDLSFLRSASLDAISLGLWMQDYNAGQAGAREVAGEAFAAAERIGHVEARDPSLRTAQRYLTAMLTEYGEGMKLRARGEDAGERLYRAYGLANFARDVLVQAQPELAKRGCDVSVLL